MSTIYVTNAHEELVSILTSTPMSKAYAQQLAAYNTTFHSRSSTNIEEKWHFLKLPFSTFTLPAHYTGKLANHRSYTTRSEGNVNLLLLVHNQQRPNNSTYE